jgi:hypothetical protein
MRLVITPQRSLDEIDIAAVQLDPRSRDDIPQLLRGLQHIYTEPALRERVFAILREILPKHANGLDLVDAKVGRPGMLQWRILVLGVMRLGLNADYDRVQEPANNHNKLRQMLGHGEWTATFEYKTQTLKDNLQLFTPEILERIHQEVVNAGHVLLKKRPTSRSPRVVTRSWSRPTCTIPRTSICCGTRCARALRFAPSCAKAAL